MASLLTNTLYPPSHTFTTTPIKNPHFISLPRTKLYPTLTLCLPKTTLLTTTHKKSSNLLAENAVKIIVGSILLVGSLTCRPAMAAPVQNQKGEVFEEEEEGVEEEVRCEKLLESEPRNVEALKVVVNGKMRRGKTKESVKFVERLVEIEPGEVEWRLLQALCYEMMGEFSKAKRLFRDVLREMPLLLRALHDGGTKSLMGLAMVMHKNREGPAVFDMLNQALELARRESRVTEERNIKILIAQMHLVKGDFDEASKKYQELVSENPRDFRPYLCQGIIYSLQDKKKEADEQFEIFRNLVPEEFPQRGFLEDVVLAAKTESREQLEKEFKAQFSYKKQ